MSEEHTLERRSAEQADAPDFGGESEGVTLENVRKEFGNTIAVDDVSLEVDPGELLVLLGPSGCGKTTTLRMIGGLETPTGGTITIGTEDVTTTVPQKRDVSMVFQNYALYPHLTVRQNLEFPLKKTELSDSETTEAVESTASLLGITDHLEKHPGQLSGGQQQRVAVGRTIVRDPRVFLMDEPLSNLDAKLRVRTRAEIRDLQQELGTTTVYVTHDQEEAMSIADRIAVMYQGELVQVGTPKEIYENPKNEFVAGFLGDPSINFLDREAVEDAWVSAIDVPDGAVRLGIRPEDVYVSAGPGGVVGDTAPTTPSDPIPATLGIVEPLGNTYEISLQLPTDTLTARVPVLPEDVEEGTKLSIRWDLAKLHAFNADGRRIS